MTVRSWLNNSRNAPSENNQLSAYQRCNLLLLFSIEVLHAWAIKTLTKKIWNANSGQEDLNFTSGSELGLIGFYIWFPESIWHLSILYFVTEKFWTYSIAIIGSIQ